MRIECLCPRHDRATFTCDDGPLDNYIRKHASQDVRRSVAAVFVLTPDGTTVLGYYSLSQFAVDLGALPAEVKKKLPKYHHVPATLIGRLAVDRRHENRGLGEYLLMHALDSCLSASKQIASAAVIVEPKKGKAGFYIKYGFRELPGIANLLFLPMATVEKLITPQ